MIRKHKQPDVRHNKLRYWDGACGQYLKLGTIHDHVKDVHRGLSPILTEVWLP